MKISIYPGSLCKSNNKLVLMINRLSYLHIRARGQHTLWHPSSLSNAAHNDTAHGDGKTHTHPQTHSIYILSLALCHSETCARTHTITKSSQYLIQLGNARGKAEVIIMSVLNSSVTGGCSFSVNKEHVNERVELFETGSRMLVALTRSAPATLASSQEGKGTERENVFRPGANGWNPHRPMTFIINKC